MTVYQFTDEIRTVSNHTMIAEREREHFLKLLGQPAVRVLTDYSVVSRMANITNQDAQVKYLSVYDYFQDIMNIPDSDPLFYNELKVPPRHEIIGDSTKAVVQDRGVDEALMSFFDIGKRQIRDVWYYDAYHRGVKRSWYDFRGFLSSEEIFDEQGHKMLQLFYNNAGELKLEFTFQTNKQGGLVLTAIWLHNHHGRNYQFASYYDLFSLYIQELVVRDPEAVFISDLKGPLNQFLFNLALPASVRRYLFLSESEMKSVEMKAQLAKYTNLTGIITPQSTSLEDKAVNQFEVHHVPADTFSRKLLLTNLGTDKLPAEQPRIIYYGTGNRQAELQLGEILAQLNSPITLIVLGVYTAELETIKGAAESHGHHVEMIGLQFHDRLLTYFKQADAILFLDRMDTYSFSINEAVRLGTLSIAMSASVDPQLITCNNFRQVTDGTPVVNLLNALTRNIAKQLPTFAKPNPAAYQFLVKGMA